MHNDDTENYFSAISIHSFHVPTQPLAKSSDRDVYPFSQKWEVVNNTDRTIWVSTRQGITYAVSPTAAAVRNKEPGVTIRLQTAADKYNVRIDVRNQLNDPRNDDQKNLLKCISDGALNSPSLLVHGLEYFLSVSELDSSDGIIYLANCDLQISNRVSGSVPEHPFSQPGIDYHTLTDNDFLNCRRSMGVALRIVDNANLISTRYVNLGGFIFQIKPEKDVMVRPGLYAVLNGHSSNGFRGNTPIQEYYSIEEMDEKFGGLYKTYEEALLNGDLRRRWENEQADKEREYRLRELDLKNDGLELKKQLHIAQVKLQEIELELSSEKQKAEALRLKYAKETDLLGYREKVTDYERKQQHAKNADLLEERSMRRKEMAEFAKVALQITAQVILGIALPLMIKSSK